jgi:hypothetical protein
MLFDSGWQATPEVSNESLAGVFHHIYPVNNDNLM